MVSDAGAAAGVLLASAPAAAQVGRLVALMQGGCANARVPGWVGPVAPTTPTIRGAAQGCIDGGGGEEEELSTVFHPTGLELHGFPLPAHAGCVVGNAVLCACVCAVCHALAAAAGALLRRGHLLKGGVFAFMNYSALPSPRMWRVDGEQGLSSTKHAPHGLLRVPSVPVAVWVVLSQGATMAGGRLLRHGGGGAAALGAAAVAA
eukprot:gene29421-37212_t